MITANGSGKSDGSSISITASLVGFSKAVLIEANSGDLGGNGGNISIAQTSTDNGADAILEIPSNVTIRATGVASGGSIQLEAIRGIQMNGALSISSKGNNNGVVNITSHRSILMGGEIDVSSSQGSAGIIRLQYSSDEFPQLTGSIKGTGTKGSDIIVRNIQGLDVGLIIGGSNKSRINVAGTNETLNGTLDLLSPEGDVDITLRGPGTAQINPRFILRGKNVSIRRNAIIANSADIIIDSVTATGVVDIKAEGITVLAHDTEKSITGNSVYLDATTFIKLRAGNDSENPAVLIDGENVDLTARTMEFGGSVLAGETLTLSNSGFVSQTAGTLTSKSIILSGGGNVGGPTSLIRVDTPTIVFESATQNSNVIAINNVNSESDLMLADLELNGSLYIRSQSSIQVNKISVGSNIDLRSNNHIHINGAISAESAANRRDGNIVLIAGAKAGSKSGGIHYTTGALTARSLALGGREDIGSETQNLVLNVSRIEIGVAGAVPKNAYLKASSDLQFEDSIVKDKLVLRSEKSVKSFENASTFGVVFAPNLLIETTVGGIGHSEIKPLYIQTKSLSVRANAGTANSPDGIYIYNINDGNTPLNVQSAENLQGNVFLRATRSLEIGSVTANNGSLRVVSDAGPLTVRPNSVVRSTGFSTMLQVLQGGANSALITIGEGSQVIAEGSPSLNKVSIVTGPMTGLVLPLLVHEDGTTALQNTVVSGNPYISLPNGTRHFLSIGVNDTGGVDTTHGAPNLISGNLSAVVIFAGATSGNQGTGEAAIKLMGGVTIRSGSPLSPGDLILIDGKSVPGIPLLPRNVPALPSPTLLLPSPPPDNATVSMSDEDFEVTLKPVAWVQGRNGGFSKSSNGLSTVWVKSGTILRRNGQTMRLDDKGGSCIFVAKKVQNVFAGDYMLTLSAGTICFLEKKDDCIKLFVLHDEVRNSLTVSRGEVKITSLNAGEEFFSGSAKTNSFGRRQINRRLYDRMPTQTSELSLIAAMRESDLIQCFLVSAISDKEHEFVRRRVLKTQAALAIVTSTKHGAFDGKSR